MFNNIIYYTVLTNMILGTSTCVHMYVNMQIRHTLNENQGEGKCWWAKEGKCKQVKKAQYFLPKNSEFYSNECDKFPNQNFNADTLFSPEQ